MTGRGPNGIYLWYVEPPLLIYSITLYHVFFFVGLFLIRHRMPVLNESLFQPNFVRCFCSAPHEVAPHNSTKLEEARFTYSQFDTDVITYDGFL